MHEQEDINRARAAKQILDSPLWVEAWDAYRAQLLRLIETAPTDDEHKVMQAKRLLTAGIAARSFLERLISDGAVAAETIKLEDERKRRGGLFGR